MMHRRSFMRFLGVVPVVAPMAAQAMAAPTYFAGGRTRAAVLALRGEEILPRRERSGVVTFTDEQRRIIREISEAGEVVRAKHVILDAYRQAGEYVDHSEAVRVD